MPIIINQWPVSLNPGGGVHTGGISQKERKKIRRKLIINCLRALVAEANTHNCLVITAHWPILPRLTWNNHACVSASMQSAIEQQPDQVIFNSINIAVFFEAEWAFHRAKDQPTMHCCGRRIIEMAISAIILTYHWPHHHLFFCFDQHQFVFLLLLPKCFILHHLLRRLRSFPFFFVFIFKL